MTNPNKHEPAKELVKPETEIPVKHTHKNREVYWLAGGIVVVVLFIVAYKLNQPTIIPSQASPKPSPVTQTSPTPNTDSMENWKSYTDPGFNISFSYPDTWVLKSEIFDLDKEKNRFPKNILLDPSRIIFPQENYHGRIAIINIQIEYYDDQNRYNYTKSEIWQNLPETRIGQNKDIIAKKVDEYTSPDLALVEERNKHYIGYIFTDRNNKLLFTVSIQVGKDQENLIPTFDQILSSFKFIE